MIDRDLDLSRIERRNLLFRSTGLFPICPALF